MCDCPFIHSLFSLSSLQITYIYTYIYTENEVLHCLVFVVSFFFVVVVLLFLQTKLSDNSLLHAKQKPTTNFYTYPQLFSCCLLSSSVRDVRLTGVLCAKGKTTEHVWKWWNYSYFLLLCFSLNTCFCSILMNKGKLSSCTASVVSIDEPTRRHPPRFASSPSIVSSEPSVWIQSEVQRTIFAPHPWDEHQTLSLVFSVVLVAWFQCWLIKSVVAFHTLCILIGAPPDNWRRLCHQGTADRWASLQLVSMTLSQ